MSQTAVLVWLSASSLLPTFRAELDAFAQNRWLRLEAPQKNVPALQVSAYAPDVVAELESALEEARNESAALEPTRALAALEHASDLLRQHPELPQSAWLMAEVWDLRAGVESAAPGAADAAEALRKRAAALAGPRATPFSDREASADSAPKAPRSLQIDGLERDDTLEWDGVRSPFSLEVVPGEHHARVLRNGRLLWAGWVRLASDELGLRLPVPATVPCSADDVGAGHFVAGHAVPAPHARCESYVLAEVGPSGALRAALCEREHCGPTAVLTSSRATPEQAHERPSIWPYAVAISAGVLAVGAVALWRSGALDRSPSAASESWVYNGQRPMGFRF